MTEKGDKKKLHDYMAKRINSVKTEAFEFSEVVKKKPRERNPYEAETRDFFVEDDPYANKSPSKSSGGRLNVAPDGIVIMNSKGIVEYVNPMFLKIFGYKNDEAVGHSVATMMTYKTQRSGEIDFYQLLSLVNAGGVYRDVHGIRKNGDCFPIHLSIGEMKLGNENKYVGVAHDISERRAYEEEMNKIRDGMNKAQALAHVGHWDLDLHSNAITWSDELFNILGLDKATTKPTLSAIVESSAPEDKTPLLDAIKGVIHTRKSNCLEYKIIRPDLGKRMANAFIELFYDSHQVPARVIGAVQDITDLKEAEDKLTVAYKVFHDSVEGIMITDQETIMQYVNPAFTSITGFCSEEAVGQKTGILKSHYHDSEFYKGMWKEIVLNGKWQGEVWNRHKDGAAYPAWLSITSVTGARGETKNYIGVFHNITDIDKGSAQTKYNQYHDALTGLPNMILFRDRFERASSVAIRNKEELSVVTFRIDDFDDINNEHGFRTGDLVLKGVAEIAKESVRKSETAARTGICEFKLLLNETGDHQGYKIVSDRITERLKTPLELEGQSLAVNVSFAISKFPSEGDDSVIMLKRASEDFPG